MNAITRRSFLGGAAPMVLPLRAAQRPNILWISCEDTGPELHCYGDSYAVTPNLDRLAAQGMRYTRAYAVAGVCAPSRSGIITGMYPSTLGSQHMRSTIRLPAHVRCFPEYLRQAGYYCTNNAKTDYNFPVPPGTWDESSRQAHYKTRPPGKPFFAVFNIETTHESRITRRGAEYEQIVKRLTPAQRRDPSRAPLPPFHPDTPEVRRDWANYYELITAMDYEVGDRLRELEQAGLADDTIVFFWGDHGNGLPRSKRWLYESGTHVPLIIRIPEKFRVAGQGLPGSVREELVSFIDLGPTVLNLAGVEVPEHMQGRAFLGANLKPPRQYIYGARDRMDERYDIIRAVRDRRYRYIRNYCPEKPYDQYINTCEKGPTMKELRRLEAAGKLPKTAAQVMADRKPAEELYDVEKDPHEVNNLASSPAHRHVLERLRQAHQDWLHETKDLGFVPEPELIAREKVLGSRYAILRQPATEGLTKRVLALMESRADLTKLQAGLGDPDSVVRYWAAALLGQMGTKGKAAADGLRKALKDESSSVRIAAARALCEMGEAKEGLTALTQEARSEDEIVRLNAALALDELGEKARPAVDALKGLLADPRNKLTYVPRVANHALNVLLGTNHEVP